MELPVHLDTEVLALAASMLVPWQSVDEDLIANLWREE